jgi:NAD(P)-dependent dehydrogenase (short-subunit alcohol dehydrogenase family)
VSGTARVTLRGRRILVTGGSKGIVLPRTERQLAEGGVPMTLRRIDDQRYRRVR